MSNQDMVSLLIERVMGQKPATMREAHSPGVLVEYPDGFYRNNANGTRRLWNPLVSIADVWEIVSRMRELGWHFLLMMTHESGLVIASFYRGPHDRNDSSRTCEHTEPALAICRAAVAAIESEVAQ